MANRSNIYRQRRAKRPTKRKSPLWIIPVAVVLLLVMAAAHSYGSDDSDSRITDGISADCLQKVVLPDETPEITKDYTGFTVSFNPAHHLPNYVAWELTAAEAQGTVPRENKFRSDPDVYGCATLDDYRNSGFDRGHMAPAADMKWDRQAMLDCHYLTNICPQTHSLNGGRWSTLENKCRQWAIRDSAIVIITGPVLTDVLPRAIGQQSVSVPERFFKVLLSPFANPPRAIAFIMPNCDNVDGLESLAVSVDQVEAITGLDFFACLPDDIENQIEAQANYRDWNRRKR
ncbi:MAG: DNA/RNA non-specific endonuclease [Muribaculaceae bacterium]|nr:DNA/RNA non-specific endonuclease [Muribaculaceae bacterium]